MIRAVALLLLASAAHAQMQMSAEEEEMMEAMGIKGQPMGRKNQEPGAEPTAETVARPRRRFAERAERRGPVVRAIVAKSHCLRALARTLTPADSRPHQPRQPGSTR